MTKILVTGAFGLVGSDLILELQHRFGAESVVAMGHSKLVTTFTGKIVQGDVRDINALRHIIQENQITQVYHLAGLLSVGSENDPDLAWEINVGGLKNVLDLAKEYQLQVFWPSSIAAFGPTTPKDNTPQHTILEPTSMYGVNKVSGELLCQYYFLKYGVDVRSLRYPGLTGWRAEPGNGTTEYSVHIFYGALNEGRYTCYLKAGTYLPMMYINDAIKGTVDLMQADAAKITVRTSYNFSALSFAPEELIAEITKLQPGFTCDFAPDHRQKIADSWPKKIDDSAARTDWGWQPDFDLPRMTEDMYRNLKQKLQK